MMKKILCFLVVIMVMLVLITTLKADLLPRGEDNLGHNLVYDTELDITWYDFSYYSPEYKDAVIWANQLSVRVGTVELTEWRLPSLINGKGSKSGPQHYSEVEHLYLSELEHYQVLHPWAFPGKWRYFDNLPGGHYWIIHSNEESGVGSDKNGDAPVYNSFAQKLQYVPISDVNRPKAVRHTFFYDKNTYLGVAVHQGDIIRKLQNQK
ncbi:zinc carboxypeptidase family [Candidatus Scalindua japonica]|uniref:Zinc carboxypeptidase family n=1 Tax=Candidatus Scalindua japonica TaxID=1284222 RepID=A0A286TUP1_9BACT|nr:hypothetical protein [Candidatus Scalindua japonica]GAX59565.1 zinc carboxypeptidase family [Candidatus Scalindua japonica]